jgi:hypothetical protein
MSRLRVNQKFGVIGLVAVLTLSLPLAFFANQFASLAGWFGFFAVGLLGLSLLAAAWHFILRYEPPNWLLSLTISAVVLRLTLGVFWTFALPAWGYDTDVQRAGYVMEDAYKREAIAWKLGKSTDSLIDSFRGYSATDQYGGLLFINATLYRFVGGETHQHLHTLYLAASISGLAVLFGWALTQKLWGGSAAHLTAVLIAFYPEALLLGSTQMREAYTVTLVPLAALLLLEWIQRWNWRWLAAVIIVLVVTFAFNQPVALQLGLGLVFIGFLSTWNELNRSRWFWPFVGLGVLAAFALLYVIREDVFAFQDAVRWQQYVSESSSGWVARQFERMPPWTHVPFLIFYGVLRPLLPAALIADGAWLWRIVAVVRALGWTLTLAMLLYASLLAVLQGFWKKLPGLLLAFNWVVVVLASYRGGGDLWDNPRYRSTFAVMQMALIAWAWLRQQESRDPWLRRALVSTGIAILWFLPWYFRRYTVITWSIVNLPDVFGLIFSSIIMYLIADHFIHIAPEKSE